MTRLPMKRNINMDNEIGFNIENKEYENLREANAEPKHFKTVYVVPNNASKKKVLKRHKSVSEPEIIVVSQLPLNFLAQSTLPKVPVISECEKNNSNDCTEVLEDKLKQNCNKHLQDNVTDMEMSNDIMKVKLDMKSEILMSTNEEKNSIESFSYCISSDEDHIHEASSSSMHEPHQSMHVEEDKLPTQCKDEQIEIAMNDVINNKISTRRAAHIHGIRHSALLTKLTKHFNIAESKNVLGADPALTEQEEIRIVNWIRSRYKKGCPIKKIDLINRVTDLVSDGRTTRFKDGVPGEKWFNNFLTRNPRVSTLGPSARVDSRQIPSKRSILSWFKRCSEHLKAFQQEHLLNDPRRIGNVEELTLCLVSSKTKLAGDSSHDVLYLPDESSGNIMVLIGACADGMIMPPMPVFSCRKPPPALINSIPSGWGIGLSKDGLIDKEVVHSFFQNILIPWLTEQDRLPFILFIDKLKVYLSVDIADFCAQKGLLIYNFYPNSCTVTQPMYKSVINNVKKTWSSLSQHRNDREALLKFCPNLSQILFELAPPHVVVSSFKECGLYPFNPKAPDYSKCLLSVDASDNKSFQTSDYAVSLDVFESMIGKIKTEIFRETLKGVKLLRSEDKSLYKIWYKLVSKVDVTRPQSSDIQDYKHEQIVRGAYRKLPRPETYLMVIDDGNDQELEAFSDQEQEIKIHDLVKEECNDSRSSDAFERSMVEAGILSKDMEVSLEVDRESSRDCEANKSFQCYNTENWKVKQGPEEASSLSRFVKVHESRKRDKTKKLKIMPVSDSQSLEINKILYLENRICTQCNKSTEKLIKCMVCKKFIHFECMMHEEQQIMSDLYEDNVAFDYICPTCSS